MEVDDAIKQLKFHGPWQFIVFISINVFVMVPGTWHMTSMVYLAYPPPHHCKLLNNSSVEEWIPSDENGKLSSCFMFVNSFNHNQTTPCTDGWTYDTSESGPTIITKWDLVCDRAYLSDFSQFLFTIGVPFGGILLTKPADVFGRKWVFLVYTALMSLFSLLTTVVDKIELFYLLKVLSGLFTGGSGNTCLVYLMECFSKENKSFYMVNEDVIWSIGLFITMIITFLASNWIYAERIIDIISFISMIYFAFWLHDTVPWLHANNRIDEAEKSLLWAAKVNNVIFERPILKPLEEIQDDSHENIDIKDDTRLVSDDEYRSYGQNLSKFGFMKNFSSQNSKKKKFKTQYSILELVKNKYLLRHMSFGFILFVVNLGYYGIFNISGLLSVNRFINGLLHILFVIPASPLIYLASKRFGRRIPLIFVNFVAVIPLFACAVTISLKEQTNTVLYITATLNIIFRILITASFAPIHIYGSEIFPTSIRSQANGIFYFIGRMGLVAASFFPTFIKKSPQELYLGVGVLTMLAGFLSILLPETIHRPLPETIEDIEDWYKDGNSGRFIRENVQENVNEEESGVGNEDS